jgi:hypothetical protein
MGSYTPLLQKYLAKYPYTKWSVKLLTDRKFNNIIVVPALAELDNIKRLLRSLAKNNSEYFNDTLVLFVVNNAISAREEVKSNNKSTIDFLNNLVFNNYKDEISSLIMRSGLSVAYIDACSKDKEMNDKDGGVGLARKIGMDLALQHFSYESNSNKLLICLDADCTVSNNYLTSIVKYFNTIKCKAAVINYEHSINGNYENQAAIICYELFLRYYLLGLKFADSPYAFHTIGSAMVCDYESYIQIGGMNKLKAAEDFYFLEKLSKITSICTIQDAYVYPSSRSSFRVPFGTGQRVNRFLAKVQDEYLLYHPQCFMILKKWLNLYDSLNHSNIGGVLNKSRKISLGLNNFLIQNRFENFWEKICLQNLNKDQIFKQKKYWFDAFKTLKLIHYLRDNEFPLINMFDAIDILLELYGINDKILRDKSTSPDLVKQMEYLLLLRRIQNIGQ